MEVVRQLTPEQAKRMRLFLQSPYFNNGYNAGQIVELHQWCERCGAVDEHPELDKAYLSGHFFPDKPYREKEKNPIDSLASELFRLVRKFLTLEDEATDLGEIREGLAMSQFYLSNNLEERFQQTTAALRKTLEDSPYRDARYFLQHYELEYLVAKFQSIFMTFENDANLLAAHRDLDLYFAIQKLDLACALDHQRRVSDVEGWRFSKLTETILNALNESPDLAVPLTRLYALVLTLLENDDNPAAMREFEQLLAVHRTEIPADKYRNLQAFMRVFITRQCIRQGGADLYTRLFDLHESHLREGYLYLDGKILPPTLRQLVTIALKLGKSDWAETFLQNHPPARITGTRYPEEAHNLCLAEVYFFKKDFDAALNCLNYKLFENVNYRILADVLIVKIYFETRDELLETRLKALDQKVRRSKLSEEGKLPYLNFIRKLDKIIKYGWQPDGKKMAKLADEIRQMPAVLQREWLLAKLEKGT